ncbi:hypothetical protein JQ581_02430 [Bradyrhizobium liaoningense]|uniref:hypothetical protein n=1 Tax=Bradyrhizobium liaoningense TaxID=43992 RepID=UPI001BA71244|nr:hypothetical protein [Bradyrhizobium liaoningense]MBR0735771.1 hypothetical protein [Bradyrhizobium liaoningense]
MASKTELDFTKRTIAQMAQEMVNAKSAFDRSFTMFKAIAKEHGVKLPKPE